MTPGWPEGITPPRCPGRQAPWGYLDEGARGSRYPQGSRSSRCSQGAWAQSARGSRCPQGALGSRCPEGAMCPQDPGAQGALSVPGVQGAFWVPAQGALRAPGAQGAPRMPGIRVPPRRLHLGGTLRIPNFEKKCRVEIRKRKQTTQRSLLYMIFTNHGFPVHPESTLRAP